MNGFLDDFLVGLILLAGFGYATYALGPKSLRVRLLTLLGAKSRLKPGGACGGCDNCGADAATKTTSGAPSETRVSLAKIGRRR